MPEIAKINRSERGWVKGQPKRFVNGHQKKNIPKVKLNCQLCGKEYKVIKSREDRSKYCSKKCQVNAPRDRVKKKYGDLTYWDGYLAIYLPDHPKANISGIVMLHNYIMEKHLEKSIPEGFVVHHIDGNKLNNNLTNLVLVTPSVHSKIHAREKITKGKQGYQKVRV